MKKRKTVLLLALALLLSVVISGCEEKENHLEKMLVGDWYLNGEMTATRDGGKGPALILYSNGTCEMASEYGTGKWSVVNNNQLQITNYYGESETKFILSIDNGQLRLGEENGTNAVIFLNHVIEREQENGSKNLVNETFDKQKAVENTITLVDASPFSDGVAWVRYVDTKGEWRWGLLRTDGTVVQPQELNKIKDMKKSDFSAGYAYVTTDAYERRASDTPDCFKILNRDGEVTAQSPNDGNSYQIVCGGDGIFLVKQLVQSMTENTTSYGVISHNGTWIQELTPYELCGNHPLSAADEDPDWLNVSFEYLGEGVFCTIYRSTTIKHPVKQIVLFNALTGQNFRWQASDRLSDENDKIFGQFYDGSILARLDHQAYRISTDFEVTPLDVDADKIISYSEGIVFWAEENHTGAGTDTYSDGKFYHISGSLAVDLSQYELVMEDAYNLYRYNNGYAAVVIKGADGQPYLGIIDTNGEFNFEPQKIYMHSNTLLSKLCDGTVTCEVVKENTHSFVLFNLDGTQFTLNGYGVKNNGEEYFSDGFLLDTKKMQFIDKNGNVLSLKWA